MKYVYMVATAMPLLWFHSPSAQSLWQKTQHCAVTILAKAAEFTA